VTDRQVRPCVWSSLGRLDEARSTGKFQLKDDDGEGAGGLGWQQRLIWWGAAMWVSERLLGSPLKASIAAAAERLVVSRPFCSIRSATDSCHHSPKGLTGKKLDMDHHGVLCRRNGRKRRKARGKKETMRTHLDKPVHQPRPQPRPQLGALSRKHADAVHVVYEVPGHAGRDLAGRMTSKNVSLTRSCSGPERCEGRARSRIALLPIRSSV